MARGDGVPTSCPTLAPFPVRFVDLTRKVLLYANRLSAGPVHVLLLSIGCDTQRHPAPETQEADAIVTPAIDIFLNGCAGPSDLTRRAPIQPTTIREGEDHDIAQLDQDSCSRC